jgi:hypothetical protein
VTDRSPHSESDSRVVPFRRRGAPPGKPSRWRWPTIAPQAMSSQVESLAKYERAGEDHDYRRRMLVNGLALAFTALLIAAGLWIAITMADMRKNQDCYLTGRRNCTPIDVKPAGHGALSTPRPTVRIG